MWKRPTCHAQLRDPEVAMCQQRLNEDPEQEFAHPKGTAQQKAARPLRAIVKQAWKAR